MKKTILLLTTLLAVAVAAAQNSSQYVTYGGKVCIKGTQTPIDLATVLIVETNQWSVADANGNFAIDRIRKGEYTVNVEYLGYKPLSFKLKLTGDSLGNVLFLQEDNLVIEDVVITARESTTSMNTERKIEKTAIDHLQMVNMSDISSLMPGGKTVNPNLIADNALVLRGGGTETAAAAFGTAVEVDGVRISTNSSFGQIGGASTRNVSSSNIESIEVVTGIPSVEYGDMTGGMVRVKTKKGKTPYTATFTTNPNTKQFSLGKGFGLGRGAGVLNANMERTVAISNPTSPYTSYARNVMTLNYSNTLMKNTSPLHLNFGLTGNIGGMNTEDDPDAVTGTYTKVSDNAVRANMGADWMLNRPWITTAELAASVNYADNISRAREFFSSASQQPAVNATSEGYHVASQLPTSYYNIRFVDSKQLDYDLSLKATLNRRWGQTNNKLKVGLAYKANGNIGRGEYYETEIVPNGYRPRPYTDIPYMHNAAFYAEDQLMLPVGSTQLSFVGGVRAEKTYIAGSDYRNTASLSPRFNVKWTLIDGAKSDFLSYLSLRAVWGITEKLPSFNVLYPSPQYRDIQVFGTSYGSNSIYVYHTTPYQIEYNENLRWTRNSNFEAGVDTELGGVRIIAVGYYNRTKYPYELTTHYKPFSYKVSVLPSGVTIPSNPSFTVDSSTGNIYMYDKDNMAAGAVLMNTKVLNQTFAKVLMQDNGSPIDRSGVELTVDFGQIRSINTSFRIDANYSYTRYQNTGSYWRYPENTSHTSLPNRSYQYVGIYVDNGSSNVATYNGKWTRALDANFTAITHIPAIRLIISLRLEASLLNRSKAFSLYNGKVLAFTVSETDNTPTGGNVANGNSYTALYPLYYMDLSGTVHEFTAAEAANPDFASLIIRSGNAYQYNLDGYNPYMTANLSVTKEIGNVASLSFYANNFTNVRRYVTMYATGIKRTDLIPEYYYGLTLRLKF